MHVLTFSLHTVEPVLAARPGGDPNSAISFPYLPGALVRGALISEFLKKSDIPAGYDLAGSALGRRLFLNNDVRYLNAYPIPSEVEHRVLPTPLSFYQNKSDSLQKAGTFVFDLSVAKNDQIEQPKTLDSPFCSLDSNEVACFSVDWNVAVHTQRERSKGRATKGEGAVYRYQAIAPGQTFAAVILAEESSDVTELKNLLPAMLWIGGARSAGYGCVQVEAVDQFDTKNGKHWREASAYTTGQVADIQVGERLVITLLSDLIVRHPCGAYANTLCHTLLSPILAESLYGPVDAFRTMTTIGGFNRTWGLPLPQTPALAAGSVFVYEATQDISASALLDLENVGLGERRAEGFGRIACNAHQVYPELISEPKKDEAEPAPPNALTGVSKELAQTMVDRMLRAEINRRVLDAIHGARFTLSTPPSRTQLARLRTLVLSATPSRDLPRILVFNLDEQLKPTAMKQWDRTRIARGDTHLRRWIVDRLLHAIPDVTAKSLHCVLTALTTQQSPIGADQACACVKAALDWAGKSASLLFSTDDKDTLVKLLTADARKRKEALDNAKYVAPSVDKRSLAGILAERLNRTEDIERELSIEDLPTYCIGDVTAEIGYDLRQEITLRLIEGMLHRAAKEAHDA